ncbi:MAG: hypothetical protein H7839_12005 [Magnetococcus sp. YQC-5]
MLPTQTQHHMTFRRISVVFLALGSLMILFGPTLLEGIQWTFDPNTFNDDARQQIPPLYLDNHLASFVKALDVHYFHDMLTPGYKGLYRMALPILDPMTFSKLLTWLLYGIFLLFLGLTAFRLGGIWATWATLAFILSSGLHLDGMAGGLPRSFGPPMIAALAWMLVTARILPMAMLTVLAASVYPVSSVICGLSLATLLLLFPATDRSPSPAPVAAWSLKKRFALLAITLAATLLLMLPQLFSDTARRHGPLLTTRDCQEFPEIGPQGRYGGDGICTSRDFLPRAMISLSATGITNGDNTQSWSTTWRELGRFKLKMWDFSRDELLIGGLWSLIVAASFSLWRKPEVLRLLIVPAVGAVCFLMAQPLAPYLYLPQRYLEHTAPIILVLLLPVATATLANTLQHPLFQNRRNPEVVKILAIIFLVIITLLFMGGKGNPKGGFAYSSRDSAPLYDFFVQLPEDALIAGWPRGIINNLSLVTKRSVLLSKETHQAFHRDITRTMRQRMNDLIDALYATTPTPLLQLRDRHGVTHLLVDRELFTQKKPLKYFAPFQTRIEEQFARVMANGTFELERQLAHAEVYRDARYSIIDLKRLHGN